jgi:hypothetical protein
MKKLTPWHIVTAIGFVVFSAIPAIITIVGASNDPQWVERLQQWRWILIAATLLSACGVIAIGTYLYLRWYFNEKCHGDRNTAAENHSSIVSRCLLGFDLWCRVPTVTDMGGIAIALTASQVLYAQAKNLRSDLDDLKKEWDKEVRLGDPSVTAKFIDKVTVTSVKAALAPERCLLDVYRTTPTIVE